MDQKEEGLIALITSESWKYVEQITEEELSSLQSIAEIETTGEAEEIRIEILARKRAAETVKRIMGRIKSHGNAKPPTTPLTRSMK
jgi:hypothetical protein